LDLTAGGGTAYDVRLIPPEHKVADASEKERRDCGLPTQSLPRSGLSHDTGCYEVVQGDPEGVPPRAILTLWVSTLSLNLASPQ
jgi:hypothetical protein